MHASILLLAAGAALSGLADFAGTWSCTGRAEASPSQAAHAIRATLEVAPGPWTRVRYAEQKTRDNPVPQAALERWGQLDGIFVRYLFDSAGGSGRAESPGPQDGALVWSGEYRLGGEKVAFRETFTRKGDALLESFELNQSGEWKVVASATCARGATK